MAQSEDPVYYNGLIRYDMVRDPVDHVSEPALPDEIGVVHAVHHGRWYRRSRLIAARSPEFLSSLFYETAMCGATIKVVLPTTFDPGDPDSCQRCVGPVISQERVPRRRGRHEARWDDEEDWEGYGLAPEPAPDSAEETA